MKFIPILFLILTVSFNSIMGQGNSMHHFSFSIHNKAQLDSITRYISIDKVSGLNVEAYANQKEFSKFIAWNIPYTEIAESKDAKVITMATTLAEMVGWDRYPTYEVYVEMMEGFVSNYPNICSLHEIGTLASGRKLLALKISDNVQVDNETEPELLYTSSIHGDETTGFILLLRLINELLSQYGNAANSEITELVNETEIWINPLANPDGTYHGGNSSITGAIRYNDNYIDLNRNYPDADGTQHPDGNVWQEETILMMQFAQNHHFALSANFHGGAEVVNYPWDTWSRRAADDAWWQMVSFEYASFVHANSPTGYFTDLNNGITNGYDWYTVDGGRQDYMNYFHGCREVTIELTSTKMVSSDALPNYWTYHSDALLHYLYQGLYGIRGTVTNPQGVPLHAKIFISSHDQDSSWVFTDIHAGDYARYLKAGEYSLTFSANGYQTQVINGVVVTDAHSTLLNVIMVPPQPALSLNKDKIEQHAVMHQSLTDTLLISNNGLADLHYQISVSDSAQNTWLTLSKQLGIVHSLQTQLILIHLNADTLVPNLYSCNLLITGDSALNLPVSFTVDTIPYFNDAADELFFHAYIGQSKQKTIQLKNLGGGELIYTTQIEYVNGANWLSLSNMQGSVSGSETKDILCTVNSTGLVENTYRANVVFYSDFDTIQQAVMLIVDTLPEQWINKQLLVQTINQGQTHIDSVELTNRSEDVLTINNSIYYQTGTNWLLPNIANVEVQPHQSVMLYYMFDTRNLSLGNYSALINYGLPSNEELNVSLYVTSEPVLEVSPFAINKIMAENSQLNTAVLIKNTGGSKFDYTLTFEYDGIGGWGSSDNVSGTVLAGDSTACKLIFDSYLLAKGNYAGKLVVSTLQTVKRVPITLTIDEAPEVQLSDSVFEFRSSDGVQYGSFYITNSGGSALNYKLNFNEQVNWIVVESPLMGELLTNHSSKILFKVAPEIQAKGTQVAILNIETNVGNSDVKFLLDAGLGASLAIKQDASVVVFPNPFTNEVSLRFNVADETALVCVYNLLGKLVAQLRQVSIDNNQSLFYWNGCNSQGNPLPSGTYFYKYQSKTQTITGKLQKQ